MQSTKNKYVVRSLKLRSLRSWFKHLPLIYKSFNYVNDSEYCSYLSQKNQCNIGEIIQRYVMFINCSLHRIFYFLNYFNIYSFICACTVIISINDL